MIAPSGAANLKRLEKNRMRMLAMSPADWAAGTETLGDDMSPATVITTRPAYTTRGGSLLSEGESDTWLAAAIDKRTGRTLIEIMATVAYPDQWRFYTRATYASSAGPIDVAA